MRDVVLIARPDMTRILTAVPSLSAPDCADRTSARAAAKMLAAWLPHSARVYPRLISNCRKILVKLTDPTRPILNERNGPISSTREPTPMRRRVLACQRKHSVTVEDIKGEPCDSMLTHLVGPGGAGKSTIGVRLADRLNVPFIDLDACFLAQEGDISDYLRCCGYDAYANRNVEMYLSIAAAEGVIALSSGFMTYAKEVHPSYTKICSAIAESMTAFVLLPSFDFETCVAEIVRRQVQRPLGLLASHEEAKIRQRFSIYMALPTLKLETMRPPDEIVTEILGVFIAQSTGRETRSPVAQD